MPGIDYHVFLSIVIKKKRVIKMECTVLKANPFFKLMPFDHCP